ncbi:pentatricopeptide repeat-containing protein At4g20740 [Jatropha curcas]|nr:pentatricopeptide repeat-containing protein At4g20740 [Jatropha curcas]
MGKWRNRRPRRFFYQREYKDPASSYYDHEDPPPPHSGFVEDGVPSWEKRFCDLVGSVPWQKIVNCKKFMYCHSSVINWNDSAGEEAFQKAKGRFWAEINGLRWEISLPDPDMYVDDINWDPNIDPDLIKDLEQAFFAPEEGKQDKIELESEKTGNFMSVPSEGWSRSPNEVRSSWACNKNTESGVAMKDKAQSWSQQHVGTNSPSNLNNDDNPWEHFSAQENEAAKTNTRGGGGDKLQGWNHNGYHANQSKEWSNNNLNNDDNPWECSYPQGHDATKGNEWGDCSEKLWGRSHWRNQVNRSKGLDSGANPWKQNNQVLGHAKNKAWGNFDNISRGNKQELGNSWQCNFTQGSETPKDRELRGWKRWDNHSREPKDLEFRQMGGAWGTLDDGHRKREGTHQYTISGNKHTRFQGNYHETSHRWRGEATNKRVGFAFEILAMPPRKPYFFYGHRKPSQNRPVVRGGLFSNRQTIKPPTLSKPQNPSSHFDFQKWDPQNPSPSNPTSLSQNHSLSSVSQRLSPISRFIRDAFRINGNHWGPPVVNELRKLRRVTPDIVAEVLKVENNPHLASKFFHWAGKQKGYQHNFASYNAFAYCLNRSNLFRSADQLPELMDSQGKPPTEKQFEILIRMHSDANRGLRVFYVYQKMKKFGVKPRVFLYNRIMDALIKTGHLDLALSVYEDFKSDGLVEDSVTYMMLAKGLCKVGRIEEAMEILGRMRTNLCKPDVFAYTAMIRVLVGEGNLDGSLQVWEEMKRDGVDPDVMAYVTLVTGLCKGGRVVKGYELFKEMKKKGILIDRAVYGLLIDAFVEDGKVGSACDLLKDLMDSGYRADLGIYNSLIQGLCNVKQVDKAHKLFKFLVHEGLEPDFNTVNPMLVFYSETKRMNDFCNLLVQMDKLGFSLIDDISKFFSFLVGEERTMMALEVFEDLKLKGYNSVQIYNILMEAFLKIGEVNKALSLFSEMKDLNFEPDSTTYSIAVMCFVEDGNIQQACVCHNKIIEMSCVPSIPAYCSLAKGLCDIGEIDEAMMLVRDCLGNVTSGPMEFKYTLTILHVCRSGDADKVIEVLNEMMQEGCPPNEVVYCAIISGMCKHGTLEEARKVFTSMRERKLLTEAKTIVYDEILIEHMKKKTADLVLSGLKFFGLESKLKAKGCTLLSS